MKNKLNELELRIRDEKPHIIAINEVKPNNPLSDITAAELSLAGYKMYTKNITEKTDRGIVIYVDEALESEEANIISLFEEYICIEINLQNASKLLFGCIYRSDKGKTENNTELLKLMKTVSDTNYKLITVVGYFNIPGINWQHWTTQSDNPNNYEFKFIECVRDSFMFQHVTAPTRCRGNDNPNVLDLILSNEEKIISNTNYLGPLGKSDHCMLKFNIDFDTTLNKFEKVRKDFNRGDYTLIKLKSHGMGVNIVTWIQNWLTDRWQRVSVEGETSAWTAVHSGVPQGSVLWPLLFLVYINDLEDGVASNILKFADDTKNFRRVQTRQECRTLQDDLNRLDQWSAKWQMVFNQSKCKCLHIGRANGKEPYEMHNTVLLKTSKEKDLGVTISADWKVSEQCGIAARKGNQLLGMIKRNITYREKNLIIPLYKSIVRPHLEYCIQAWRPHLKKDIDKLERVQRRATKLIPDLRILSYEDRVQQCKLTTLETRRVRGDQIEVFKITHGIEGLDSGMFFKYRTDNGTRGHSWALAKERCKLDIRKYAFSQRTINEWNRLPGECVNATSVNMFKNKIDNYFQRSGYV